MFNLFYDLLMCSNAVLLVSDSIKDIQLKTDRKSKHRLKKLKLNMHTCLYIVYSACLDLY